MPATKAMIPRHILDYGDIGAGKTRFAATWPASADAPQLVFAFDPMDKLGPYIERGVELVEFHDPFYEQLGIPVSDVLDAQGQTLVRIEQYLDDELDPENPGDYQGRLIWDKFLARLTGFGTQARLYGSVILDSWTGLECSALMKAKVIRPMSMFEKNTDTRQWYGLTKEYVEPILTTRIPRWRTNVLVIMHTSVSSHEFNELELRGLLSVGQLKRTAPRCFGEVYRSVVKYQGGDDYEYRLQTKFDGEWLAQSWGLHPPNPCEPTWEAIHQNYWQSQP